MESTENLSLILNTTEMREKFVQDLNGTTMGEVVLFSAQFPLLTFLALSIELLILNKCHMSNFNMAPNSLLKPIFVYLLEVLTIVLPVTLMFTLLADYVHLVFLFVILLISLIIISSISSINERVMYWKLTNLKQILLSENISSKKQLFITYFRSFVLLVTAVSILGVDFHIYPRRYAKTETYGVSLMDLGVGLFIVSNALVEKRSLLGTEFKKTLSTSSVLIVLGTLRYVLVQRFDYNMHVSEYGMHWNFFITLAMVKLLSSLSLNIFRGQSLVCGFVLILTHQYFLSHSLESLVLSNKGREDWFNANREGIISLGGYLSLHMISISMAKLVNPIDKKLLSKDKLKAIVMFTLISVFLLCVVCYLDSVGLKVSRRLANLPYVLWIIAISLELFALFLLVEFLSVWFLPIDQKYRTNLYNLLTPTLLESINFNGLLFFLISNVFTGLINIYIDAFSTGLLKSLLILVIYMCVDCAVVLILYVLNVRLQF